MADIIKVLPDSIANQIAAGEVIQRPASVVKELLENALDAGSTSIDVVIKDAGKTLIQITDNGCGMSETDARMAFERHATSKISKVEDLFAIRTMGFRGEALPSIASIAEVELKSKQHNAELGTYLHIRASEVIKQEPVPCKSGTTFIIRNLFFNVPARRKFLKSNNTEIRHILNEFHRVALANSDIALSLHHNNSIVYKLPASNLKQRIINLFSKRIRQNLIPIQNETTLVRINGFIGKPEYATKKGGEQFFFVNQRFIRHPYFHKAVMNAYERVLPPDMQPSYFLFFDIDPNSIDINIHPTKNEVNFADAAAIFQILEVVIKEALGRFNVVPSIDFDQEGNIPIHQINKNSGNTEMIPPSITINPDYNPFNQPQSFEGRSFDTQRDKDNIQNWEKLYEGIRSEGDGNENIIRLASQQEMTPENKHEPVARSFFQLKNKYILTSVRSGLMIIDQRRAHERILFEKYCKIMPENRPVTQQCLYPVTIECNGADFLLVNELIPEITNLGFSIKPTGNNAFIIHGTPSSLSDSDPKPIVEEMIANYKELIASKDADLQPLQMDVNERVAASLAKSSALKYGTILTNEEMQNITDQLFACQAPNYSPTGKRIVEIITYGQLDKRFD